MRNRRSIIALLVLLASMPGVGRAKPAIEVSGPVLAGAAKVDSTWHVGASSGQYAGDPDDGHSFGIYDPSNPGKGVEPYNHSTTSRSSYGVQGRENVRALVVQGADGKRIAVVSNDLYIPQDLVNRRVAGLLAEHDLLAPPGERTNITDDNLVVSVSHSHSSPYYSTPAWGPWAFEDVFDIRFFDHIASKMAQAVIEASAHLVPVRIGGSVSYFDKTQRHSFGPQVGDDGTPAGFPHADFPENHTVARTENEKMVFVIRVDDISTPASPQPLANWVVFGLHPEMLDGNDLLASEYVNTMERFVDREVGGITLFSQENTGTAEPARSGDSQPPAARAEFSHRQYAQVERAARLLADTVKKTRTDIEQNTPEDPNQFAAFSSSMTVAMSDLRFAPPSLRPVQTVSNCRSEKMFHANPGVPLAGLPDCVFPVEELEDNGIPVREVLPFDPGVTYDTLREAGVPIPDNYGAPSFVGLQETPQVHLQAIRLGGIGITVCPCEQWGDQAHNIRSRLNQIAGDFWDGFDWTTHARDANGTPWCTQNANTTWTCADPRAWSWDTSGPIPRQVWSTNLPPIPDIAYRKMRAQIHNDAAGWDALTNVDTTLETDPVDPAAVKGNYTHEELTPFGFDLVVPVGMSNDYEGYIATYREWERGDHYRKALTGLGPHSSDFFATRLSRMAANLNGASFELLSAKDLAYSGEDAREYATAQAIGAAARSLLAAYDATLPADGGSPSIAREPADVQRFSAASIRWIGGDNYVDTPNVRVQRLNDDAWVPFADGSSEVEFRTFFPKPEEVPLWRAGQFTWNWEATFEAFGSDISLTDATGASYTATPAGTYRFVIDGKRRALTGVEPYHLVSNTFEVKPWNGLSVSDIRREGDGTVSFIVPTIDYPDTYASPFPFITGARSTFGGQPFCLRCSFRPWADFGTVARAEVTIARSGGGTEVVPATFSAGRWRTTATLGTGDSAYVAAGGIADTFEQTNAAASSAVPG